QKPSVQLSRTGRRAGGVGLHWCQSGFPQGSRTDTLILRSRRALGVGQFGVATLTFSSCRFRKHPLLVARQNCGELQFCRARGHRTVAEVIAMSTTLPPGPRDWTFGLSQLRKVKQDALGYYTELKRRYGDVVRIRFGPYPTYVFFHPEAIREVLVVKAKQFRRFTKPMEVLAQWNGNSVLISEGDEWLRQRRMVQPAFHPKR